MSFWTTCVNSTSYEAQHRITTWDSVLCCTENQTENGHNNPCWPFTLSTYGSMGQVWECHIPSSSGQSGKNVALLCFARSTHGNKLWLQFWRMFLTKLSAENSPRLVHRLFSRCKKSTQKQKGMVVSHPTSRSKFSKMFEHMLNSGYGEM